MLRQHFHPVSQCPEFTSLFHFLLRTLVLASVLRSLPVIRETRMEFQALAVEGINPQIQDHSDLFFSVSSSLPFFFEDVFYSFERQSHRNREEKEKPRSSVHFPNGCSRQSWVSPKLLQPGASPGSPTWLQELHPACRPLLL